MAYNFEATFVQPLLKDLDNGLLSDAEDWANAITKYYVKTIKKGLPQGVPPTLPAPGLNPLAPPPFNIGVSAFNTTNSRQRIMYQTIHAYFLAKDIELNKGAIEGLASTVRQLLAKARTKKAQLVTLRDEIKTASQELKELPQLFKDIQQGVKILIDKEKEKIKELGNILGDFKLEFDLTEEELQTIFADELALVNSIKNVDVTSLDSIREIKRNFDQLKFELGLTPLKADSPQDLERARAVERNDPNLSDNVSTNIAQRGSTVNFSQQAAQAQRKNVLKRYIKTKLFEIFAASVNSLDIILDPTKFLDFANEAAAADARLVRFAKAVARVGAIERYVKPKIKKLQLQFKAKKKEIEDYIKPKIKEQKKKFSDKVAELREKKKQSKQSDLYVKTNKRVKDFREKNEKRVKKIRDNIRVGNSLLKQSYELVAKVDALSKGLIFAVEDLKADIVEAQTSLKNLGNATQQAISGSYATVANFQNEFEKPDLVTKKQVIEIESYINESGLGEFAQVFTLLAVELKCDLSLFKSIFDKNQAKYIQYQKEISTLDEDIETLFETAQQFDIRGSEPKEPKEKPKKKKESKVLAFIGKQVTSLKKLLQALVKYLKPRVNKVVVYISNKIKQLKKAIPLVMKKFKSDIEVFLINLVPLKSDVQDEKDKVDELEAKKRRTEEKRKKLQKTLEQSRFAIRASKGLYKLGSNIAQAKYFLGDNDQPITDIAEGIYGFRSVDQSPSMKRQLMKEKAEFLNDFKTLAFIESLIKSSLLTLKDIKESDFKKDFKTFIDEQIGVQKEQNQYIYNQFYEFFNNPPETPEDLINSLEQLTATGIEDISLVNKMVELERKYLKRTVEVIKTIASSKAMKKHPKVHERLLTWQKKLSKRDSFILYLINMLKEVLKDFAAFIAKSVTKIIKQIKEYIKTKIKKVKKQGEQELKTTREKKVNLDAIAMSVTFGIAARLFWTGARWTGPTGTTHIAFNIGRFKAIKAKPIEGASAMIRQIAASFEGQLKSMSGLVSPPPNTGIPPMPFKGYI